MNSVLLVEDHPIFLKGLVHLLGGEPGFHIIGEARDKREALAAVERVKPHIVVVDLTLGDDNGLDLIKDIRVQAPETLILVLSMHDERFYADRALSAGANGYCMKAEAAENIVSALRAVASGKIWLSPAYRDSREGSAGEPDWLESVSRLSDREFQVFNLIGKGLGTVEIAAKLNLSTKTIDTHKENLKIKLHCNTSQTLRQYAIEWQNGQPR